MTSANARDLAKQPHAHLKPVEAGKPDLQIVPDQPYSIVDEGEYPLAKRLAALENWGEGTHSFLTLYPGVKYFTVVGMEGYIPLTINEKFILIIGQPVCDPSTAPIFLGALKDYADENNCSIGAIPAGEVGKDMMTEAGFTTFYVGREPIYDLQKPTKLNKSMRQAIARVKKKGLTFVQYDEQYRPQMEAHCEQWKDNRELPAMGFLFELRPFELQQYKKYFLVVDKNDNVQAFLSCSPIYGKNGCYLEDLIRSEAAPNGTTELLVTGTMEALAAEGLEMATLGLAPLSGLPEHDEQRPMLNKILKFFFNHLSCIYHFKALEHFKAKFKPAAWEGNYLCHYRSKSRLHLVGNLLQAFMPYDMNTLVRHKMQNWSLRKS